VLSPSSSSVPDEINGKPPVSIAVLAGDSMFNFGTAAVDPRVAGFGIRATARVIDMVLAFAVAIISVIIAMIVLAIKRQPGSPEAWGQAMGEFSLWGAAASILGNVLYHSISESVGGASLGKLVCGLRVVSEDFAPVSFRGAAIRSAAFFVDSMFFGWIGYRSMERSALYQRLGDHWGRTAVVKTGAFRAAGRGPARVLVGLFLGLMTWVTVQVLLFVARGAGAA
jgi:uncharacterized RDD family membrane protein YckC